MKKIGLAMSLLALLALAPFADARGSKPGTWWVPAGATLHLTAMDLNGANSLQAWVYVDGVETTCAGSLYGGCDSNLNDPGDLPDLDWTNGDSGGHLVKLLLRDSACGQAEYYSDGSGDARHAKASKTQVSIADAGPGCVDRDGRRIPALGDGNFNATVSVGT
jgi:hypothetical protein